MYHKLSLINATKSGIGFFIRHFLFFILVGILFFAIRTASTLVLAQGYVWLIERLNISTEQVGIVLALNLGLSLILAALSVWLMLGNVKIALNVIDSGRASIIHLFKHFSIGLVILQILLQVAATLVFYFLGTQYSQILLLVILLICLALFGFVYHFIADKNMNVVNALRHSFSISKHNIVPLLILWAILIVFSNAVSFLPIRWWTGLVMYPLMQPLVLIVSEAYRSLVKHS